MSERKMSARTGTSPIIVALVFLGCLLAAADVVLGQDRLQLLRNGGFEEDEMSFRGEPASSCGGYSNDQYFNMQDRFPDGWTWPGVYVPSGQGTGKQDAWPRQEVTLDAAVRRSGTRSLLLQGNSASLQQSVDWNRLVDIYADVSGSNWGPTDRTEEMTVRQGLFQDILLAGWVRCEGVPADAAGSATLTLGRVATATFDLPADAADWTPFELLLSAEEQARAGKQGVPGRSLSVTLSYQSPTGAGRLWLDDLTVSVPERAAPNLLPNGSFEAVVAAGDAVAPAGRGTDMSGAADPEDPVPYPEGWSRPFKWTYLPPPAYYVWNHWQHFFTPGRGAPRLDALVARTGRHSLRLDLLAGDEYALESPTITIGQEEARPIEVTAWVKADRLRHLDFMLVDEQGRRVPANPTLLFWGGPLSGTHEWIAVRKVFQGFEPIRSFRLRVGGRGFNGTTATDVGVWHAYNQVSTVWIDDMSVREVYSTAQELADRGVAIPAQHGPAGAVRAAALELGERLYGENEIAAVVRNNTGETAMVALEAVLVTPSGREQEPARSRKVRLGPGQPAALTVPYELTELSPGWRQPGTIRVSLLVNGEPAAMETYFYGTWPVVADVRPSKAALDETENPILVAINLGLARKTLAQTSSLTIEVVDRRTGKAVIEDILKDIPAAIASTEITPAAEDRFYFYMPRVGLLDHRNLVLREMDISELPLRPWDDPESDWVIRVTGEGGFLRGPRFVAESHPFARLTKMEEVLEPVREVTVDPEGHFLRINGKPLFVFAQSHANGAAIGGAPVSRSVAFYPDRLKVNGMNGASRWAGIETADAFWEANVYAPMVMVHHPNVDSRQEKLQELERGELSMWKATGGGEVPYTVARVNNHPAALGVFVGMSEGIVSDSPSLRAQMQYADALREKINRPVGYMDNHSQFYPWNDEDRLLDHIDLLFMEREEGNLFRPELTVREWMKRKKRWMICDLPQTYENVPHARERYQAIKNTLNGARGWFGIQGCADPSLYRLLGGELRHMFTFLSANQGCPEVAAPEGVTARAWRKGDRVLVIAEQHNPVPRGSWDWRTGVCGREAPSHTGASRHLVTPVKGGYAIHGYNDDIYREVAAGDSIRQEVCVEPGRPPQAVFLIVPGNGDFNHVAYWGAFDHNEFRAGKVDAFLAGECYSMAAYGINSAHSQDPIYLEYQAKRRFPASGFVRMGELPKPGEWTTLTVPLDGLKLTGKVVDGLMFMTSGDGLAWWGRSTLVRADGTEEVMLDGRMGRDPEQFRQATISLPGLANGTVRVVGECRTLQMTAGSWSDDLAGEDLYDCFTDGWLGDGITYRAPVDSLPEALELSYSYDDSPRCVRVYEVIPE